MDATQMLAFMADGIQGKEIFYLIASIVLLLSAIVLIVAVLIQSNSSKGLSGAIAGGSDTFYGRNKGKSIDKKLTIVTIVLAVVFGIISLSIYGIQSNLTYSEWLENLLGTSSSTSSDEYESEGENTENAGDQENENQGGTTENENQGGTTEDENQGGTTEENQGGTTENENQGGTTEDENQGGTTEGETNGGEDANN